MGGGGGLGGGEGGGRGVGERRMVQRGRGQMREGGRKWRSCPGLSWQLHGQVFHTHTDDLNHECKCYGKKGEEEWGVGEGGRGVGERRMVQRGREGGRKW